MSDWEAFQRDVLDVLRQYQGYFDFLEQVGSLGDSTRPDCFARITRADKKEVWIVDAKSKTGIDEEDDKRMRSYVEKVQADPVDVGLDHAEIQDHDIRPIMVTPVSANAGEFKNVPFRELHQFLQNELVYTDTERAVRELGKMMRRGQLSHEQARLLHDSLQPYRKGINQLKAVLNEIESAYAGAETTLSSEVSREYGVAVDAVLEHEPRSKTFLIDVPYNRNSIEEIESKKEVIQNRIETSSKEVFYAAVNRFDKTDDILCSPEELEQSVNEKAGVISARRVAGYFEPKVPLSKRCEPGRCVMENGDLGFALEVSTEDDIRHEVVADLPEEALESISGTLMNSRKRFGSLEDGRFSLETEIKEDLTVEHSGTSQNLQSFRESVREVFLSTVSTSLAQLANRRPVEN